MWWLQYIGLGLTWLGIFGLFWTARRAKRARREALAAQGEASMALKQLESVLHKGPLPVDMEARAILESRLLPHEVSFVEEFKGLIRRVAANNNEKGWRDNLPRNDGELVALAHSELSELLEGLRHGNHQSDKIPGFSCAEEEYADVIIRACDHAEERNWDLALAIVAKMRYNTTRPRKHGNKAF